jgi:beta-lactamase class A
VIQLVSFSRIRSTFPQGMTIAGIPVAGLTQQQAAERIRQAYSIAVEIRYGQGIIQAKPAVLGFELELEAMIAEADLQRINQPFWSEFWDHLWSRSARGGAVPLRFTIAEDRLRSYLKTEVAARYDQPPTASVPVAGSTNFKPGQPGTVLDIERAVILIEDALKSPTARVVNMTINKVNPAKPSFQNLQILLKQIIELAKFDGVIEIFLLDLQTNQELHFAYQQGKSLPVDITFTASSTIKIPVMVSIFKRLGNNPPKRALDLMTSMIEVSVNEATDALMQDFIDKNAGPLEVTKDIKALGYKNTFLAGYFYEGAPLLQRYTTPSNQRKDVNTRPDPYNMTVPAEIGQILDDIYQCANSGGGALAAVFPGEITQAECKQMISFLVLNRLPLLITAGLPEGTQIAHKHGWGPDMSGDGLLHNMGDAGIVYTPGGNYILSIFLHTQSQLLFDPANAMVADLSRAIYNYFNQQTQ